VHVIPIGFDNEGHELHKVVWNTRIIGYTAEIESKLLRALRLSSTWTLTYPDDKNIIAILRMNKCVSSRSQDIIVSAVHPLEHIKDISKHYPVVWKKLDNNLYGISIHRKRLNEFMRLKGYNCLSDIINSLYSSILLNLNWKILDGAGRHFLRIKVC
jgi:hypothetical protein